MGIIIGILLIIIITAGLVAWSRGRSRTSTAPGLPSIPTVSTQAPKTAAVGTPLRADIDAALQRDYGAKPVPADLRKIQPTRTRDHVPPNPSGGGFQAWSPRTRQLEVAGEWYRAANLRQLFGQHATVCEEGAEIRLPAVLVPDPSNPYDDHAVAVFVDNLHVGYMTRTDARNHHTAIAALPGREITVPSRQWLRGTPDDIWARVTLSLPTPEGLQCPNPVPSDSVALPPGSTVQVTREEEHMDHLARLLNLYGSEKVIAASLRSLIEQRPRSTVELVAVEIDGQQVGVLSPTQTTSFLPLVRRAEAEGRTLTCRATLRGNAQKVDVALHASKVAAPIGGCRWVLKLPGLE